MRSDINFPRLDCGPATATPAILYFYNIDSEPIRSKGLNAIQQDIDGNICRQAAIRPARYRLFPSSQGMKRPAEQRITDDILKLHFRLAFVFELRVRQRPGDYIINVDFLILLSRLIKSADIKRRIGRIPAECDSPRVPVETVC